ncbi:glycosyl hydrolase [Penicillium malachiteum]|nr:glycosyl hydrolase [Penicillium malachiteum]
MPQLISNPIISGFSPDPSTCAVDGLYFAVTSSFHFFPGIPIYLSKGLITWSHSGERRGSAQNFIIQTSDIWSNSWSDPVFFDFHGIDPNLFFDDDDRTYIQGSRVIDYSIQPSTTIDQFEIDVITGQKLSEQKTIWEGFIRVDAEGPRLYKRGQWYYLVITEGGTFEHHLVSAAKSRNLWGPYESADINSILPTADVTSHFQQTGHPDIFQDAQGQCWATVLGVRKKDGHCPMGRELLLTKVSWPTADDWPVLGPIMPEIEVSESSILGLGLKDIPFLLPKDAFLEIRNGPTKQCRSNGDCSKLTLIANPAHLFS